ncbi:Claudin-10 [Lonchura striata]|uniref:Claudin n=2 Tax=Australaves TaxID=3073809 RepID=A0A218VAM5_9PASE|nr:Claudin-10 [Lonchura striata domestica]
MASTSAEITAFLLTISGWVLVSSTLPTDYWKVSTIDGTVITTATFWANLWKTCVTDSTGVSNCKDFPSMLALDDLGESDFKTYMSKVDPIPCDWECENFLTPSSVPDAAQKERNYSKNCHGPSSHISLALSLTGYIQACRGLMISAVCLGFFGAVFGLIGMKCTKVGGSDQTKAKIACLAGLIFILSGLCSMTSCSLYANRITSEFFDPSFVAQNFCLFDVVKKGSKDHPKKEG